jgi:hypothetical protein
MHRPTFRRTRPPIPSASHAAASRLGATTLVIAAGIAALSGCASVPAGTADGAASSAASATAAKPASAVAATGAPPAMTAGTSSASAIGATVAPASGAAASAGAAAAGQPRPFAEVIKDAKETPGLIGIWQKDEKVWLEIAPEQFGVPYLFTANLSRGVGEKGVYGGMMLLDHVVEWKRIGNAVQLIAKNYAFTGGTSGPLTHGVKEGFTDSLLGATTVASQPHPERKTVLIDANALFLTDIPVGERFTSGVHLRNYTFDAKNSSFEAVRNGAEQSSFVVSAHYSNPKATLPPPPSPTPPPSLLPPFANVPDARSLFLGYTYNIAKLPPPMPARRADPRVGHFDVEVWDFSSDAKYTARTHIVQRWRLEKKEPEAAVSEPKEPIVFWLDRNVPERYRAAVRDGILEWNKAFEKIGFRDAIVVRQQDVDAPFDTFDARHSTVRWFVSTDAGFAIGPRLADPRTGEILNAQVAIAEDWSRSSRTFVVEQAPSGPGVHDAAHAAAPGSGAAGALHAPHGPACTYATESLAEMAFGLDLLAERDEIEPGSPEADAFVAASLKAVVMHEIGHALGLRHNFRASTVFPLEKIADPAFSREHGLSGSVMDYNPINIAVRGETQGAYFERSLGPYDYWAVEYAYRPLPSDREAEELARIAARGAAEPLLAFSSDEESLAALDPDASQFDLGADPLLYLSKRLVLTRELWQRLEQKQLKPGESYDVLRRSFDAGFRQVSRAAPLIARYVGGVHYVRDYAGTGRLPLTPVAPDKQRAALRLLASGVFAADSFRFRPEFLRSMGVDYLNLPGSGFSAARFNPDFSLRSRVLALQTSVLNQLLGDTVLARLLDSESKVAATDQALTLPELFATLRESIWSELASGGAIAPLRRDLQREHLRRIANALTRPSASTPADANTLFRDEAKLLAARIRPASAANRDAATRAHLAEAAATLDEALKAPLVRQGV